MADFEEVLRALDRGLPAAFPTDTVFGLAVAVNPVCGTFACGEEPSPEPLFALKERDRGKPVAWLVGSPDDLLLYGRNVPQYALELARAHWPGAFTLVVEASDAVPASFRSQDGTIGLRMPDSSVVLGLIERLGCPLATTSANRSGMPDVSRSDCVDPRIGLQVPVLDDGAASTAPSGVSSTVVLCTGQHPLVLRQGSVGLGL